MYIYIHIYIYIYIYVHLYICSASQRECIVRVTLFAHKTRTIHSVCTIGFNHPQHDSQNTFSLHIPHAQYTLYAR